MCVCPHSDKPSLSDVTSDLEEVKVPAEEELIIHMIPLAHTHKHTHISTHTPGLFVLQGVWVRDEELDSEDQVEGG